jgi:hypothetical protein
MVWVPPVIISTAIWDQILIHLSIDGLSRRSFFLQPTVDLRYNSGWLLEAPCASLLLEPAAVRLDLCPVSAFASSLGMRSTPKVLGLQGSLSFRAKRRAPACSSAYGTVLTCVPLWRAQLMPASACVPLSAIPAMQADSTSRNALRNVSALCE